MSQHDLVIDNSAGATVRADINSALQALGSTSKGAVRPPTVYAGQLWLKDTTTPWELYIFDGLDDIFIGKINAGANTVIWDWDKATDIASAATTDIGAASGNFVTVTGTTTITALGTVKAGAPRLVHFSGVLTLTHNATSLILPGAANIPTAAGDVALFVSLGAGNWRCAGYFPGDGVAAGVKADMGQCLLTKVGSNLRLDRHDGRSLFINGRFEIIPTAGVTLSATGLSANVTYFIYAFMSSGVMTLEASTSGYGIDPTYGHLVKTGGGDPTRTLVGMARTIAGPAWVDTNIARFVRSFFHCPGVAGDFPQVAAGSTASTTSTEIMSGERVEYITWFNESVLLTISGTTFNSTAGALCHTKISNGGTLVGGQASGSSGAANERVPFSLSVALVQFEGYHYVAINGHVSAGTGNWENSVRSVLCLGGPLF